jgi:DNA-binding NarL/FixJ family response regulator
MDLTIPGGMGGKEAIQGLLDLDPKARAIVSSGYSDDPLIADHRNHGFKGALVKPYRLRELSNTMSSVLEEGTIA